MAHVAQIIRSAPAAKAACKDVGRDAPVSRSLSGQADEADPGVPGMTLDKAFAQVPSSKSSTTPTANPHVIDLQAARGHVPQLGVHAAGVIIRGSIAGDVIPLCKTKDDNVLTQFEGPIGRKGGLLKMASSACARSDAAAIDRSGKQTKNIEIDMRNRLHR